MRTGPGWRGMTLAEFSGLFPEGQHGCLVGMLWIVQLSSGIPHFDSRKPETYKKALVLPGIAGGGDLATCISNLSKFTPWPQSFNSGKSIIDEYPKWSITKHPSPSTKLSMFASVTLRHDRQPRLGVGLVFQGNMIIRPPGASQSTCT